MLLKTSLKNSIVLSEICSAKAAGQVSYDIEDENILFKRNGFLYYDPYEKEFFWQPDKRNRKLIYKLHITNKKILRILKWDISDIDFF